MRQVYGALVWGVVIGLLGACASVGTAHDPVKDGVVSCRPDLPNWPCANRDCTLCCCEDGIDLQIPRALCCSQADSDGDGVLDKDDKCPKEPEDKDGHKDKDGCPDPDVSGGHFIPDMKDRCPDYFPVACFEVPNKPESRMKDSDGCPDPPSLVIHFIVSTDRPTKQGLAMLKDLAQTLPRLRNLSTMEVRGLASPADSSQKKLARRRTHWVSRWLQQNGIPASKLRIKVSDQVAADPSTVTLTAECVSYADEG